MAERSIISSQIDNILLQRKARAVELRRRRDQVMELKQALSGCNQLTSKAKSIGDARLRKECMETLSKVKVPMKVMKQTDVILRKMDEAIKRFERESLNIATVGKARQGKSTILQAISNLGNDIIPAFDAGDCTGAVSIIHNDSSMEPGRVRVDLTFRSKDELLNIVKGYINNIDPEYLTQNSLEYDDIGYISMSDLEMGIEEGEAGKMVQLEHLRRIVDDFTGNSDSKSVSIRDLCGQSGMSLTNPDEIRKYVAQNNGKDITDPLRENYYSYLAVNKAEIYCRFADDVGKLVLVDTIGLGDTQLGIEDAMLDTVDKQCDATIVVTKPISGVTTQDMSIYEMLQQHFKHRDMKKWLFYIANLHKGVNDNVASTFHKGIVSNPKYSIADCKLIDGSDSVAVRQDFLMPMLTKLLGNLDYVDNIFIQEINKLCADLKVQIQTMLESFPNGEFGTTSGPENLHAYTLGIECYNRLTSNLDKQVRYWYEEQHKPNATLWNRVKDILNGLEEILPSEENLQRVLDQSGDLQGSALWQVPLNYVRNEISDQFIALDDLMGEETLTFKNTLIGGLYDSLKSMGGLEEEPAQTPNPADQKNADTEEDAAEEAEKKEIDKTRWLWNVMEPMLRDNPEYIQIYRAFQFLDQFNFNIRAQIIQEVRYQLRIINDMTTDFYMMPNYTFSKSNAGQAVHYYMTSRLAILEDGLRESLMQMNKMPNQAFYAAAEEFYDRLTFASDFKNGRFVNMANIWGKFFSQYSGLIWKKEMEKQESVKRVMKEYKDYCDLLAEKLSVLAA